MYMWSFISLFISFLVIALYFFTHNDMHVFDFSILNKQGKMNALIVAKKQTVQNEIAKIKLKFHLYFLCYDFLKSEAKMKFLQKISHLM